MTQLQQQQSLQTLRQLNNGKQIQLEHQLSGQIQSPANPQHPSTDTKSGHVHSENCSHGKSDHGNNGPGGKRKKNYGIMVYCIFTCLSCLYLQTQHLNPFVNDHTSRMLSYISWFDVLMCLWCYIQTYRIGNKVSKLPKLLSVDTVQNRIVDEKYNLKGRFCKDCDFYKLPRISHCSTCGECVYKLDHHCMWTQTCIGHRNQRPFYLFCCYMCFGVLQFWYSTIRALWLMVGGCGSTIGFFSVYEPGVYILWAITCFSAAVVGVMIIGLTISHTFMILTNYTTLDSMKQRRMCAFPFIQYRKSYYQAKNVNTYDRGQIQNLKSLFGDNILTFWMPLAREIQNQFIIQPMNPQPTKLQLMQYTDLWQNSQKINRQVERMIPQLKIIYQGKSFTFEGNQFVL